MKRVRISKAEADMDELFESTESLPGPLSDMTDEEVDKFLNEDDSEDDENDDEDNSSGVTAKVLKIDDDKRMVWGWASVASKGGELIEDKQGDVVTADDLQETAHDFMMHHRVNGRMHKKLGTGTVVDSIMFTKDLQDALGIDLGLEGWFIGVKVSDEDTWQQAKSGNLAAFSIGGSAEREKMEKYNPHHKGKGPGGGQFTSGSGGGGSDPGGKGHRPGGGSLNPKIQAHLDAGAHDYSRDASGRTGPSAQFGRRVRSALGRGKTESARGQVTMFFENTKEAHAAAVAGLTAKFGAPKDFGHSLRFIGDEQDISLKNYNDGENNFASFGYMSRKRAPRKAGIMGGEGLAGKEALRTSDVLRFARNAGADRGALKDFASEMTDYAKASKEKGGPKINFQTAMDEALHNAWPMGTHADYHKEVVALGRHIWSKHRVSKLLDTLVAKASPEAVDKYNTHHKGKGPGGGQFTTGGAEGAAAHLNAAQAHESAAKAAHQNRTSGGASNEHELRGIAIGATRAALKHPQGSGMIADGIRRLTGKLSRSAENVGKPGFEHPAFVHEQLATWHKEAARADPGIPSTKKQPPRTPAEEAKARAEIDAGTKLIRDSKPPKGMIRNPDFVPAHVFEAMPASRKAQFTQDDERLQRFIPAPRKDPFEGMGLGDRWGGSYAAARRRADRKKK